MPASNSVALFQTFQSAPPRGGEREVQGRRWGDGVVSIRAPARGRTRDLRRDDDQRQVSIRAPARGRTTRHAKPPEKTPSFNPRPREGANPSASARLPIAICFNPRPREGANPTQDEPRGFLRVSIRAPARGRTQHLGRRARGHRVSIRAPARGRTCCPDCWAARSIRFNPRPREGANSPRASRPRAYCSFNPRPREGANEQICSSITEFGWTFQSAPPRGGERRCGRGRAG